MTASPRPADDLGSALSAEEGGRKWLRRGALIGTVILFLVIGLVLRAKSQPPPPALYVSQAVQTGDVVEKVQATGAVQPLSQVNVGAQANGRVVNVLVDFNSLVKKGDVLAEIDGTALTAQVSQSAATLAAQRAQIESARANLDAVRLNYERVQKLVAQNLASKGEADAAKGQYEVAVAQLSAAQAQAGALTAQLSQAQTNASFTKIISPVNGIVISRTIDPGNTVVASFQTPTLFVLAQDLKRMRVMADIDEADVGRLKAGMQVDATVDAFPGEIFHGTVQQVRFSPNSIQGVVTYAAVVEVDNPEEKLRPGMTATVSVKTQEVKNTLRVPNAALRYKPSPAVGADGKPIPQSPEPPLPKGQGKVYLLTSDKPGAETTEAKVVQTGANDGIYTQILSGLNAGDKIVTDETDEADPKKRAKGKMF